jgi:hypothetical protein
MYVIVKYSPNTAGYIQTWTSKYSQIQSDTVRYSHIWIACKIAYVHVSRTKNVHVYVCEREIQSKYSRIHTDMNLKIHSDTVRYSQIQSDMDCWQNCICACIQNKHKDTYMHICIDLNQSICPCMCLYVYCIQANMHLIHLLCERRYMHIHAYTCRYIDLCITYTRYELRYILCICRAYANCMSLTYIHIHQSRAICVLYMLQIHTHMQWQDH